MTTHTDRSLVAERLFHEALELDSSKRIAFLAGACGADDSLRAEVSSLLRAAGNAAGFLDGAALAKEISTMQSESAALMVGKTLGHYRIVEVIASGGMGTVYRGVRSDDEYEQRVAIKLIKSGAITADLRARFYKERQTLAQLEHPYITRLIDGGTTDENVPYLVMEHVDGLAIDKYCDEKRLGVVARLEIFNAVCEAVHFAHRNLVVHRDLKPRNILVMESGIPKLLDFGIAKLIEDGAESSDTTATLARVMTPRYASPEQIRGGAITTSTDVYSLGVILFELLSGHTPYDLDDRNGFERAQIICESDPGTPSLVVERMDNVAVVTDSDSSVVVTPERIGELRGERPAQLRNQLRGDLDNIILKAMHREPHRRYASVQQFSEDIDRYLNGQPVIARKATAVYRFEKWVRRNAGLAVASFALVIALVVGIAGTTTGMVRAKRARLVAGAEREAAVAAQWEAQAVTEYFQGLLAGASPYNRGRNVSIEEMLADATRRVETELAEFPGVEAGVRLAIANTYAGMWAFGNATPHLESALATYLDLYGENDARVARCLSVLGRAKTFARDPLGVEYQRRGLAIRRSLFGSKHRDVAESLGNLGYALWHAVRHPQWLEAESYYRRSLAMYSQLGTGPDADVARFRFSLGMMLSSMERLDEAVAYLAQATEEYRGLPATQDHYRVKCLQSFANVLLLTGDFARAEEVIAEYRLVTPSGLASETVWRWESARACFGRGDAQGGLIHIQEVLVAMLHDVAEGERSDEGVYSRLLVRLDAVPRDKVDAGWIVETLEEMFDVSALPFSVLTGVPLVADLLRAAGMDEAARELLTASAGRLASGGVDDSWRGGSLRCKIGSRLVRLGDAGTGETLLRDGFSILADLAGENHIATRRAETQLCELYRARSDAANTTRFCLTMPVH